MGNKVPNQSDSVDLKPGEVLASNGKKFWVIDVRTGATTRTWKEGEPAPNIAVRVDPVLLERLQMMENDFDWTDPFLNRALYEKILHTHAARAHLDFSLEQTPVLPHTAYKRVHLIPSQTPADVLLVGDDDLLSIAFALLGHRVTALEIDPFTIKTIEHFKREWNLEHLNILSQDLTKPLAQDLRERFDYCFTDPLSTYNCLNVFMSRALACLKKGGELFVALTDAGDAVGGHLASLMHLPRVKKYRNFNHYYTVGFVVCHYTSHLLRFRKAPETTPFLKADDSFTDDIFSFANSFDFHLIEDFYDCEIFDRMPPAAVIGEIHKLLGPQAQLVMPMKELEKTAFIVWQGRSMRVRVDAKRRWAGIDAVPLERQESLSLARDLKHLLKAGRAISRVAERNPGRP